MNLYKFYWDCGRMGDVDGLFVASSDEVAEAIGREVYFGEILGKHSEIYGTLEEKDITLVSDDLEKVQWLLSVSGGWPTISGYNPLEYLEEIDKDD